MTLMNILAPAIIDFDNMIHISYQGKDFNGVMLSVVGIVIVFTSLLILSFVVAGISAVLAKRVKKKLVEQGKVSPDATKHEINTPDEVNVAIAMALSMYFGEIHDYESGTLTIDKIKRPYQPWSSKLYNLRQVPVKQNTRR